MVIPIIDGILGIGNKLIDKLIPDPAQKAQAQLALLQLEQNGELTEMQAGISAILAEANGQSSLQRNWRPITMLSFVFIVMNNYIIYPYLSLFWHAAPILPLPPDLWELIKIGIGGYTIGRSAEKIAVALKK